MIGEILFLGVAILFHSVILLALLWIMIKLQKLDYHWLGLIGSAFLAGGLDMIPYFGHLLAVLVLYICIWKVTRADIFPDAVFTVVIAYALMFCVNLFLLGALMGDLRPDLHPNTEEANNAAPAPALTVSTNQAPQKTVADSPAEKTVKNVAKKLSVKGLIRNGPHSILVLSDGTKTRTLALGEKIAEPNGHGSSIVQFDKVDANSVTVSVDGIPVKLKAP